MKSPPTVPRLSSPESAAPAALRDALHSARNDVAGANEMDVIAAKLGPLLDQPLGAAPTPIATGAASHAVGRTLVAVAATVTIGGAGLFFATRVKDPPPAVRSPAPKVSVAEVPPVAQTLSPPLASTRPGVERPRKPRVVAKAKPAPQVVPAPVVMQSEAAMAPPSPAELELLTRARALLAGDPEGALALTDRHVREFRHGSLVQEREVVAVDALVRLGRIEDAEARGQRFLSVYEDSIHRRRIEALLAEIATP